MNFVDGLGWRYASYVRPYQAVYQSPLSWARRAVRNYRAGHSRPAIAYVCADPTNPGDYASHLGIRELTGMAGAELFCAPVMTKSTLSVLGRRLDRRGGWNAVFVGGGGLLQQCFDEFWAGLLQLDVPLVLFGVGAAEAGDARRATDPIILRQLAKRALALHVRDRYTADLLAQHGATDVSIGVCPSINYLMHRDRRGEASTHLLHVVHDWDLKSRGLDPAQIRHTVQSIARDAGLIYDETSHTRRLSPALIRKYLRASVVVSSRLHGCIFSYALRKPFVAIGCDRKVQAFVEQHAPAAPLIAANDISQLSLASLRRAAQAVPTMAELESEARNNVAVMTRILNQLTKPARREATAASLSSAETLAAGPGKAARG